MNYRFKPTNRFWESFYDLTASQKDSTRRAWKIFKQNPFDPRLRTLRALFSTIFLGNELPLKWFSSAV